jgi:NTP pyrophosphatase (non-canonical NTP hydrolase)
VNLAQYPALAARTEKELSTDFLRLEHAALGIQTETGEIATPIKRIAIYGMTLDSMNKDGKTTLRQNIAEEIGDVLWYIAIIDNVYNAGIFARMADVVRSRSYSLCAIARGLATQTGLICGAVELLDPATGMLYTAQDLRGTIVPAAQAIMIDLIDLCNAAGLNLLTIAADNIAKLQARYPDKYSDVAAEARADKGGEDARNS